MFRISTLITMVWLACAATSVGQPRPRASDAAFDVDAVRTYTWMGDRGTTPLHDQLAVAIGEQLASHGLRPTSAGERPDVLVVFDTEREDAVRLALLPVPVEPFAQSARTASVRGAKVRSDLLTVGIVDATTGRMLWRASARSDALRTSAGTGDRDHVDRLVRHVFRQFPARTP